VLEEILEQYEEETLWKADGFDQAVLGVEQSTMRLIYSVKKCIEILTEDMPEEEAIEYFNYNTLRSYIGDKTPIWCNDMSNY
jgi:hypothetical protein